MGTATPNLPKAGRSIPMRERERVFARYPLDDRLYMRMALRQAHAAARADEVPIGAVVVYRPCNPETLVPLGSPHVLAQNRNRREATQDPSAHAEFLALCEAACVLDTWRLTGCTVYVTLEPCSMCAGLMLQARVDRCVYGAFDNKAGALGSLYKLHQDTRLNHAFPVTAGVLATECAEVLQEFFADRRLKGTES